LGGDGPLDALLDRLATKETLTPLAGRPGTNSQQNPLELSGARAAASADLGRPQFLPPEAGAVSFWVGLAPR
jgi:hypothetical protein